VIGAELSGLKDTVEAARREMDTNFASYQDSDIIETNIYYEKKTKVREEFVLLEANAKTCQLLFKKIEEKEKELYI
jgi:hypothetical protein